MERPYNRLMDIGPLIVPILCVVIGAVGIVYGQKLRRRGRDLK